MNESRTKIAVALVAICVGLLWPKVWSQVVRPVSVQITHPTTGQVVSNTFILTATASSTAGPIKKVEFYHNGILMDVVTNLPAPPSNLRILPVP